MKNIKLLEKKESNIKQMYKSLVELDYNTSICECDGTNNTYCADYLEEYFITNVDPDFTAAVIAEPIQGEGGFVTPPPEYFPKLAAICKKYGIKVPKSKVVTSINDIPDLKNEFEFPILVKGKFYDAYIAYNDDQVINHFNKISAKWGLPVIIQEFIRGTEVNVVALGDGTGKTIAAVPMRKQYITDKGKAWSGVTIGDKTLLKITYQLFEDSKWKGGMELEMIRTNANEYFLIEINPRIPAWVYLAVGAGQNIPEALVKLAMGEDVEPMSEYEVGKMFIRYSYDLIGNISDFEKLSISGEL
jgi:carbamoyl-phosphate synthase large subunit